MCQEQTFGFLFDHLVGAAEQRDREREPQGLGGFEIDNQFDFRGLLHREVAWLLAFENSTDVNAHLSIGVYKTGSVAHQAADRGEVSPLVDRGHRMASCQRDDCLTSAE